MTAAGNRAASSDMQHLAAIHATGTILRHGGWLEARSTCTSLSTLQSLIDQLKASVHLTTNARHRTKV
jgi:hypothetical protein